MYTLNKILTLIGKYSIKSLVPIHQYIAQQNWMFLQQPYAARYESDYFSLYQYFSIVIGAPNSQFLPCTTSTVIYLILFIHLYFNFN